MTSGVVSLASKPASVRWISALAWLRIVISALTFGLAIVFISPWPAQSALLSGVRDGYLQRGGYAPGEFGPYQFGQMLADAILAAVPAALMLLFVARRKLMGLRVAAGVWVLLSLPNPLAWLLSVTTLVLAFRPSAKSYCQVTSASVAPAA